MFGIGKTKVKTEEELKKAIEKEVNTIEIIGNLKDELIKIKNRNKVNFIFGIGLILLGSATAIISEGSSGIKSVYTIKNGISKIMNKGDSSIIRNSLKKYEIKEETDKKIVLKRK